MSLGGTIPYNLRQNKAIERGLFVDLLSRIGRYRNISKYTYIGFGGPFMEDFKLLHNEIKISKMISLEVDKNVLARQAFNLPLACIELRNKKSGDFLVSHAFSGSNIVWFDYAIPKDLPTQLAEVESLVSKLSAGDIVKITLNANPSSLGEPTNTTEDLLDYRAKIAQQRLATYAPSNIDGDSVKSNSYPTLLLRALENSMKAGLSGTADLILQPLTAFIYADGQQMLTATAIILKKGHRKDFILKSRLYAWEYQCIDWKKPISISIPDLSLKERLEIESLLPGATPADIQAKLGYFIGNKKDALGLMENFVRYYRLSPSYTRVVM
ncbi:O-methyltransferase [Massilia rhizosphaerae]|uniref:O-methyltransferase n=1 Tax=Massilia rhizosphaerae TaxID=2784389 RepID=UPI0018DC7714|nr:O-methyltransferase [Massilia rhizosphaerae]